MPQILIGGKGEAFVGACMVNTAYFHLEWLFYTTGEEESTWLTSMMFTSGEHQQNHVLHVQVFLTCRLPYAKAADLGINYMRSENAHSWEPGCFQAARSPGQSAVVSIEFHNPGRNEVGAGPAAVLSAGFSQSCR